MESIVVIVGFLGAGKTTFLKQLVKSYLEHSMKPYVVINDYENANLDAQQFSDTLDKKQVAALSGNCICCDGVAELRTLVNKIPPRENGVTLIEANGTSDACELMGFLAVGINDRFLPPIQVSIVDARLWQERGYHNELEANQIQVSSLIIINYADQVDATRLCQVKADISQINPSASITIWQDFNITQVEQLHQPIQGYKKLDHSQSHWAACSVDLNDPLSSQSLVNILEELPDSILRVKGCTKLDNDSYYSFFERTPSGETFVKPYRGNLIAGPKLLVIGPGSEPQALQRLVKQHA